MTARLLIGDVFDRLEQLNDGSVDLGFTSPPFLALRSYLPADHPDKGLEIGSERTPAEFIDTLLSLAEVLGRKLAPHGTLCVELGDTYAGSGGAGGDYGKGGQREGQPRFRQHNLYAGSKPEQGFHGGGIPGEPVPLTGGVGWPLPKSLTGIPTLFAWSLAYGRNLLTGEPSPAGQWRIRNLVHWVRPNPPVGALGDKFRPATSYLIVACRSAKRWFDLDAVRVPNPRSDEHASSINHRRKAGGYVPGNVDIETRGTPQNPAGAPPLDWWRITARGYKGSHYAVFPPELCERPIKAMCPLRVCTVCGEPSRRLTKPTHDTEYNKRRRERGAVKGWNSDRGDGGASSFVAASYETLGWSDCGHDAWRKGVVLDPFAGTGTTLMVAEQNDRDSIGIDLDVRNAALAYERLAKAGITLDVDYGLSANDVLMSAA